MNKKNTLKKTAALLLGLALTVGATGCNFIVTDSAADYAQTIATVDITEALKNDKEFDEASATAISEILKKVPAEITKRDLISYFMSVGTQYVESYGYTYKDTFNMLLDGLVSREIMIQYAIAHYLKNGAENGLTAKGCTDAVGEKTGVDAEIEILKYFLTDDGKDMTAYDRAVYSLKKSLNDSLDSMEDSYITAEAEEEEHNHGSRTTPTGVGTEKEDYYTNNYEVFTGRNVIGENNEYERLDGSTTATRQKAYNRFLANLQGYSLIEKGENTSDVTGLNYYKIELASALGQALITKYYEDLEAAALKTLDEAFVTKEYNALYQNQVDLYEKDPDGFATAMDSVSDTAPLVYGLQDYGFVYNILLPFSKSQEIEYTEAKNRGLSQDKLYNKRKEILTRVEGKDLRSEWVDEHDHANYAYKDGESWYFFEDSIKNNDKYEELDHYLGILPFNGTIDEETMEATANKVNVDDVLKMFTDYAGTLGLTVTENTAANEKYEAATTYYKEGSKDEIDYSNFMYRAGTITGMDTSVDNYFYKGTEEDPNNFYNLISYANELMFAYSTDTGCFNKYFGYSVSPYTTNYMKEFEYAAQWAIKEANTTGGVAYAVAPTDYGWHIIITTVTYKDGAVYGGYNDGEKETVGTFSNLFYESLQSSVVSSHTSEKENSVLKEYTASSVTKYESKYKDLLEMDA
ncbi:MAG: hypothetical protein IJX30_01740 [Clostridia bacterium]|nr:hypothetical protein [Clostridia bacterium]